MDIIKYLPDDIIRYIIPFTYQPQNSILLAEIRFCKACIIIINNDSFLKCYCVWNGCKSNLNCYKLVKMYLKNKQYI
jgi:hypothetical protein